MKTLLCIATCLFLGCATPKPKTGTPAPIPPPPIQTKEITYSSGSTTLKGYVAWNTTKKGKRPAVLIVHEWWGHNDYVRTRARKLAMLGYTAFALDMYGEGKNTDHPDTAKAFMMKALANIGEANARFVSGLAILKKQPHVDASKIVAIGYCFGGGVVLHMARASAELAAFASFHGGLATKSPAAPGAIKGKVLVFTGGADPMVPPAQVEAFRKEMAAAGVTPVITSYPGVKHAFTNPAADTLAAKMGGPKSPIGYDKKADEDSWAKFTAFMASL